MVAHAINTYSLCQLCNKCQLIISTTSNELEAFQRNAEKRTKEAIVKFSKQYTSDAVIARLLSTHMLVMRCTNYKGYNFLFCIIIS